MTAYQFWLFVHLLLFVYWLGADLGVLVLAKKVKDRSLPFEQRALLIQMAVQQYTAIRITRDLYDDERCAPIESHNLKLHAVYCVGTTPLFDEGDGLIHVPVRLPLGIEQR